MGKLSLSLTTILLLSASTIYTSASILVNITISNTVVIVSAGNISFACDFIYGGYATLWRLNGLPLSGTNGTLDITTDELLSDVNHLQCFSNNDVVYNTTVVLAVQVQVKLCNNNQVLNAPICTANSISPSFITTQSATIDWGNAISTSQQTVTLINQTPTAITPQSTCVSPLCIVQTAPYIATAAIGGSAVLVVIGMVLMGTCSCCCRRCTVRRKKRPSMIGVVTNPLAWKRPVELTPFDLNHSSFNFDNSPKHLSSNQ